MTGIDKLYMMGGESNGGHSYNEAYVVSCMDVFDSLKIDTITRYVKAHYSKEMIKSYEDYRISMYSYDNDCENGLKNTFDCQTEAQKGNVQYQMYLSYVWRDGKFDSLYIFSDKNGTSQVRAQKVFK